MHPAPPSDLAPYIDHTLLKPEATPAEIRNLCDEALRFHFASVCVNPSFVTVCARLLSGSGVNVCTVIGFPLGATSTEAKYQEASRAIADGAGEIDMVLHIGMLRAGETDYVRGDIQRVVAAARGAGALTKVILETCLLTQEEKVRACTIARDAGADFVKTSTGFSKGGATLADVALMRTAVGAGMKVKASGGIRSRAEALAMIGAGADRIGTSSGVAILGGTTR